LLDFYIDLNTLKTGISLRDKHMRDNYLETKKYPFAEFSGKLNTPPALEVGKIYEVIATGKFKIHGVTKTINVPGKIKVVSASQVDLNANFKVLLSDYKISIPKVVFYELAEEQDVTIKAVFQKK
jgi:polyisoprenoid-binding protein YceI